MKYRKWLTWAIALLFLVCQVALVYARGGRSFGGGGRSFGGSFGGSRSFGGSFGGSRSSGGFGGSRSTYATPAPSSRPSYGGSFDQRSPSPGGTFSTPAPSSRPSFGGSTSGSRGNISTPPPSSRPTYGGRTGGYGGQPYSERLGRNQTLVHYPDRTVTYNHYWGGVMVPMGYSPFPFYGYHYFWWLPFISSPHYHSPYYGPAPVSHHAGFFGTLIGILFLILIIWLAVKIIQALARLILGGNSRVYR
ncbi:MAG: hypothetical protein IT210_08505 [Armatimonadetes bacterium]|nr:hypothetical protein [Armatimonadota bacterium]